MMNFTALEIAAETSPWGKEAWGNNPAFSPERLELAGQVTLIGMLMVFAVLAILWAVLAVFKLIFAKKTVGKKEEKPSTPPVKEVEASAPVTTTVPVAAVADDAELIAVITAAVAAYRAAENPDATPSGFRVVSYRRTNGGRAWNAK